jgi:hypothetical protein
VAGRGWGVLSCVGDHLLQEFNTLYLTRFRTYKIALSPPTKTYEGREPQPDKHLPQSPFIGQFFLITTFGIAFYQSNLSTGTPSAHYTVLSKENETPQKGEPEVYLRCT